MIHVRHGNDPYQRIHRSVLQDERLSLKAIGLIAHLLSLPPDWDVTIKGLADRLKDGITSITSGMHELADAGYAEKVVTQLSDGTYAPTRWAVVEDPSDLSACVTDVRRAQVEAKSMENSPPTENGFSEFGKPQFKEITHYRQRPSGGAAAVSAEEEKPDTEKEVSDAQHPAVLAFRRRYHFTPPKTIRPHLIKAVGDEADAFFNWLLNYSGNPKRYQSLIENWRRDSMQERDGVFEPYALSRTPQRMHR